jgi:hypothetical protein
MVEWNGMAVSPSPVVVGPLRMYPRNARCNAARIRVRCCAPAHRARGRCRIARRAGRMGLGTGAVGQRRSTPVRLSFYTRACLTYAKSLAPSASRRLLLIDLKNRGD